MFLRNITTIAKETVKSELHRQCVLTGLAVVGGVDGVNVPPPARELCGVIPADTVELHGMDAAQRTDKPLRAVLPVIQLHKVHHAPQDSRPEGVRSALPRFHDVPQQIINRFFAIFLNYYTFTDDPPPLCRRNKRNRLRFGIVIL